MEFDKFIETVEKKYKETLVIFVYDFKSSEGKHLKDLLHKAYNEGANHYMAITKKCECDD